MTAEIAITAFVIIATLIVFAIPKIYGRFTQNEMINLLITRCCYVIGFFLMVMNAAIIGEIANTAGYTTGVIWRFMWVFGRFGYLLLFFTVIKTVFDTIDLYKQAIKQKRGLD